MSWGDVLRRLHGVLTVAWLVMVPVAVVTGWIYSVPFIAVCSIYANAVVHGGAYAGGRAEREAREG